MRQGRECMAARDWAGAIRSYGQGLMEQPLLGMHYAANLERARTQYRQERHTFNHLGPVHTQVVVAAAELSHNTACRAFTLAQLYLHLDHPNRCAKAQLTVHTFVAEHEPRYVEQAFALGAAAPSGSGAPEQATATGGAGGHRR